MSRTVRNVHTGAARLRRYRAERLLRRGFPELRAKVIGVVRSRLRAQGIALDHADLEACYAQAWHGLYAQTLAGEQIENPSAWLVLATFRRAIDEARAGSAAAAKAQAVGELAGPADERDLASELDDRARLRELFEAMRSRLSARECEAASLCYLQGLSRSQAALRMGLSEARMRKLMEGRGGGEPGVAAKLGSLARTIQAGGWCEQQSSLMRAYAFGILDPDGERHALAVAHTRECPACRAHVAMLRGLATVLPPLPFALPPRGGEQRGGEQRGGGQRPARVGRAVRVLSRGLARRGGALPLSAKLAVAGAVLIGAGASYLAARPSSSPARAGVVQLAPSASNGSSAAAGVAPSASARATPARPDARRRPSPRRQVPLKRQPRKRPGSPARSPGSAALGPPVSAREFTPERVTGETLGQAQRSAPAVPPSPRPAEREFGIE